MPPVCGTLGLAEASPPCDGDEPTDGDEPGHGEDPNDGDEPSDGEEPTNGGEPTDGEEPNESEEPTDGDEPCNGEEPRNGEEPSDDEDPTEGEDPIDGGDPVATAEVAIEGDLAVLLVTEPVELSTMDTPDGEPEPVCDMLALAEVLILEAGAGMTAEPELRAGTPAGIGKGEAPDVAVGTDGEARDELPEELTGLPKLGAGDPEDPVLPAPADGVGREPVPDTADGEPRLVAPLATVADSPVENELPTAGAGRLAEVGISLGAEDVANGEPEPADEDEREPGPAAVDDELRSVGPPVTLEESSPESELPAAGDGEPAEDGRPPGEDEAAYGELPSGALGEFFGLEGAPWTGKPVPNGEAGPAEMLVLELIVLFDEPAAGLPLSGSPPKDVAETPGDPGVGIAEDNTVADELLPLLEEPARGTSKERVAANVIPLLDPTKDEAEDDRVVSVLPPEPGDPRDGTAGDPVESEEELLLETIGDEDGPPVLNGSGAADTVALLVERPLAANGELLDLDDRPVLGLSTCEDLLRLIFGVTLGGPESGRVLCPTPPSDTV